MSQLSKHRANWPITCQPTETALHDLIIGERREEHVVQDSEVFSSTFITCANNQHTHAYRYTLSLKGMSINSINNILYLVHFSHDIYPTANIITLVSLWHIVYSISEVHVNPKAGYNLDQPTTWSDTNKYLQITINSLKPILLKPKYQQKTDIAQEEHANSIQKDVFQCGMWKEC